MLLVCLTVCESSYWNKITIYAVYTYITISMKFICLGTGLLFLSACVASYWNEWNCMGDVEEIDTDFADQFKDDDDDHHDITTFI